MAKAIPNPEPPRNPLDSPGLPPPDASGRSGYSPASDPWHTQDLMDKGGTGGDALDTGRYPTVGGAEAELIARLQAENEDLRLLTNELQQELEIAVGNKDKEYELLERQKEYETLLDEKTERIRELHLRVQELEQQVRPPTPKEEELIAMSEELERDRCQIQQERRKLDEDLRYFKDEEEKMTEDMRKMEMQMSRERADLSRQRKELQTLHEEIRQELERLERDRGLSDRLQELRRRHMEAIKGKGATPPPPSRPAPPPTQLAIDLDAEAQKAADESAKKKESGIFRRLFGGQK